MMMMREKKDIRPVLLKFGVVLAFSLGGILYSIFRKNKLYRSPSSKSQPSSEHGNRGDSSRARAELKAPSSSQFPSIEPGKDESLPSKTYRDNCGHHNLSPSKRSDGDNDVYLLPEFNDLLKEFDLASTNASFSPRKDVEICVENAEVNKHIEKGDREEEIRTLRKLVRNLKERERSLEIQLLEYYGLKEQETAVMELQNRLKINNVEAKLFNLKIESLQADKRRLEEQVADYARVVSELEAAKAKIKSLKKKVKSEVEQNKEHILALQERVEMLQKQEFEALSIDSDVQLKLQKLKDVEEETRELRLANHSMRLENSELAEKLENLQNLATSFLEDDQTEKLKEESQRLRQQNEDLAREIERLQADRCTDIEELVYLRWINACLRYELRNYHPGPGKTVARDLSKSLSPKSEEKAKQLILEYAHKEGPAGEKGISNADFDIEQWSSSQGSYLTDSGDDSSVDNSSNNKTHSSSKSKIFGNLMKILRGKESHHHHHIRNSSSDVTSDGSLRRNSDGLNIRSRTSSEGSSRLSLDLQRSPYLQGSRSNKGEDINSLNGFPRNCVGEESSSVYKAIGSISEHGTDSLLDDVEKSELAKYAEALKGSRGKSRLSLDLQGSRNNNKGEVINSFDGFPRNCIAGDEFSCVYKAIGSISERGTDSPQEDDIKKSQLVKYAEALKSSRGKSKSTSSFRRRCASFSSFQINGNT